MFLFLRMIQKTNQTRSYFNLYDPDTNLKFDLAGSNLDIIISFKTPLHEGETIFNYFRLLGTLKICIISTILLLGKWFDNTNDRDNSSFTYNTD